MEQISLYFGTPISKSIIKSDLEEYVMDMSKSDEGVQISNRGGWQSKPFFKPEKEFELLWAEIEEKINMYHHTIELKGGVRISDLWFNVNYRGSANRQHQHANSIHSGVYYIKTPEKCGALKIKDPRTGAEMVSPKMKEGFNHTGTAPQRLWREVHYEPMAGRCIMFPAWLIHGVDPNESNDIRISVSFNFLQKTMFI